MKITVYMLCLEWNVTQNVGGGNTSLTFQQLSCHCLRERRGVEVACRSVWSKHTGRSAGLALPVCLHNSDLPATSPFTFSLPVSSSNSAGGRSAECHCFTELSTTGWRLLKQKAFMLPYVNLCCSCCMVCRYCMIRTLTWGFLK